MVYKNQTIRFLLNDQLVAADVAPGLLALDYVRQQRHLVGTKSGCKEGDCGACTVVLGELDSDGLVRYRPMTSCLLPMGELHGKHLVTIEGLNMPGLSPVQRAMVDCGGTQCGYCTPGFVVAMTAGLMEPKLPLDKNGMLYAISGNLCRCTGYRSIKAAGMQAIEGLAPRIQDGERIAALVEAGGLPEYFKTVPERLKAIRDAEVEIESAAEPSSLPASRFIVAGGTDLYVQRGEELPDAPVRLLNREEAVGPAVLREGRLHVDARMTFEAFADDPLVQSYLPAVGDYNLLIASWPMRTRSSLGGNLCNASPIADMTCLLLALETELELVDAEGTTRTVPLNQFYLGYKKMAKSADEVLTGLHFPIFDERTKVNWEKVSKRAWLDIATVNAACKITLDGDQVTSAHFALGGVAAIPLYLREASAYLTGSPLSAASVHRTIEIAMDEFEPIGDVRGSAQYKRLLARQLMRVHFSKLFPEILSEEAIHATL